MKAKKFTPAMRGLAALMTCLMVLSIVGTVWQTPTAAHWTIPWVRKAM